jgi:transcriptional regulator with XRE-family HTH domain
MGKSSIYQHSAPGIAGVAPAPLDIELGRRIRARRRALGMTQSELAAPLTKSYVSAVENGHVLPSLRTLRLLADRLGVRIGDLADTQPPDGQ